MGAKIVRFRCHHSNHCCRDVVCLPTPYDVLRIALRTGENPYDFLEFLRPDEITGVAKNDPTWLKADGQKFIMALKRDEKQGCYFLDRRTRYCSIYEHRPNLCRLYPFKVQETREGQFKGFILHKNVGCPRHRDGTCDVKPLHDLYVNEQMHQEDYARMVADFNARDYPGRSPESFLELFIEIVYDND